MFRAEPREGWRAGRVAEFRDAGVVPPGAIGLVLRPGAAGLLRAGDPIRARSIVAAADPFELSLAFADLTDRDGIAATLEVVFSVDPPDGSTGLRLLAEAMAGRDGYDAADLAAELAPLWAESLSARAARILWAEEGDLGERLELAADVPESVQAALFDRGLRLERVLLARASSSQLSAAQDLRRLRREEAARIRERLEFLELWQKEEKGVALAREEVEKLAGHLRQQGLLRQIENHREEHRERLRAEEELGLARERLNRRLERERLISRVEIDAERLEKELALAERLELAFQRNGWLALVRAIGDTEGQTRLLERLIEKEMSPEQLAARGPSSAHVERLEARIEALRDHIESRGLPMAISGAVGALRPVRRIWLAAGLALYRIDGDPAGAEREARPVLPPEELGHLRSVRVLGDARGALVAVGGQGGVGLYRPEDSSWEFFPFRPGESGRGGANSVAVQGSLVVASHSRLGLSVWDRREPRALRRPLEERLVPGRSLRAVQGTEDGGLIFGHGAEVMRLDPSLSPQGLRTLGSLPESVTALCLDRGTLWAGTQEGRLFRGEGEGSFRELPFRTSGPLYQITVPATAGARLWLIGARQPAVHVLDDDGGRLADYRSRYPVRWVGGGAGGPVAVDRFGQHLIVWGWERPDAPLRRVRVPDQIHSLAIEEEPR
jgi:hypothetical protein